MFGLFFGTLCLIGLIFTLRRGPFAYFAGHSGYLRGGGPGHYGGWGRGPWGGGVRSARRRWALRWFFEQLETTPGQEKVIVKALDDVRERMYEGRGELDGVRRELAQAVGGDVLDESTVAAISNRFDTFSTKLRTDLIERLTEVHAALDGRQRRQLAELIADLRPFNRHRH